MCHDVARPFARPELFSAVLAALDDADGAVPVVPAVDTLKRVAGGRVVGTLRPGGRRRGPDAAGVPPRRAGGRAPAGRRGIVQSTDDAALLERAGYAVAAVPGDPDNFKVTVAADLRRAEAVLAARG